MAKKVNKKRLSERDMDKEYTMKDALSRLKTIIKDSKKKQYGIDRSN